MQENLRVPTMIEPIHNTLIEFLSDDDQISLSVQLDTDDETAWLTLNQISQLFQRDKSVISRHIKKVFENNELDKKATVAFFATVQSEGDHNVTRKIEYFNLDLILSLGYLVNSKNKYLSTIGILK